MQLYYVTFPQACVMMIPHYHLISETANPKVNICRVREQREGKTLPDQRSSPATTLRLTFLLCFLFSISGSTRFSWPDYGPE